VTLFAPFPTPPTIAVNGDNPALLHVGDNYADRDERQRFPTCRNQLIRQFPLAQPLGFGVEKHDNAVDALVYPVSWASWPARSFVEPPSAPIALDSVAPTPTQ
jgi:hypothetical protein